MDHTTAANGVWILVPARGGSKGIPGKNVRLLNGRPLIGYTLETASALVPKERIVVSTDSDTIAHVAGRWAMIHQRSESLANDRATLDEVAVDVALWLRSRGAADSDALFTIQPTSPFITRRLIAEGIKSLTRGANSVVSVVDDRHLRWTIDELGKPRPLFESRVNRQWLPPTFAETGGLVGVRIGDLLHSRTRIVDEVELLLCEPHEALDIDSHSDWAVAEYLASRRKIVIRADSSPNIGMGHVYRAVALAHEMARHDLTLVTRSDGEFSLGAEFLGQHSYPLCTVEGDGQFLPILDSIQPDILIMDVLDSTEPSMQMLKERCGFLVALEDLGTGARFADLVVNDLYTDTYPSDNHWHGVESSILAPHFELVKPRPELRQRVERILTAFGGTDPLNLTQKALTALRGIHFDGFVTVVLGPGYSHGDVDLSMHGLTGEVLRSVDNMALVMQDSDLAITSGGRTVTELMCLGIPTIVTCQNIREMSHTHASSPFGVINLGLGEHLDPRALGEHILLLSNNRSLRNSMRDRALKAVGSRSNRAIVDRILAEATNQDHG